MTYDPSMTITSTIPAPEGSDSTSREGKAPARDGGRQRFTRPGRTATRYGKDRWRYDL
mgnify:CR=1 FL=1